MPNPSWASAALEQCSVCSHFPPRGSVLARAWERPQGRAVLRGGFAPAADFGAELGMGHGLGTCCKAERPQDKGCSFQEGKGILEKNFGTTVSPRISELPADEGAAADVQGLCCLLGNLHNNRLKRRFCRSLGLIGSTRGPVNAGEGAVAHS